MGKWKKLKFVNFLDTFLAGTTYCSYIRKENSFHYKENMQQQQKKEAEKYLEYIRWVGASPLSVL